jgi:hypothetical protein
MHAKSIKDLLSRKCPAMHGKRRDCVATLVEAGRKGGLGLLKMSRGTTIAGSRLHDKQADLAALARVLKSPGIQPGNRFHAPGKHSCSVRNSQF